MGLEGGRRDRRVLQKGKKGDELEEELVCHAVPSTSQAVGEGC